jgi:hypothetical protein
MSPEPQRSDKSVDRLSSNVRVEEDQANEITLIYMPNMGYILSLFLHSA